MREIGDRKDVLFLRFVNLVRGIANLVRDMVILLWGIVHLVFKDLGRRLREDGRVREVVLVFKG